MAEEKINFRAEILAVVFVILLCGYASAFAISSFYWRENPLNLTIGETKDIQFTLQNNIGGEDLNIRARIIKGSEIAKISDASNEYLLSFGGVQPVVHVEVSIPNDAKIGDVYTLEIIFDTVKKGTSGGLGFGASISRGFKVNVVEKPKPPEEVVLPEKKPLLQTIYLVIILVVILAIIIVTIALFNLLKKKKQNNLTRKK